MLPSRSMTRRAVLLFWLTSVILMGSVNVSFSQCLVNTTSSAPSLKRATSTLPLSPTVRTTSGGCMSCSSRHCSIIVAKNCSKPSFICLSPIVYERDDLDCLTSAGLNGDHLQSLRYDIATNAGHSSD